MYECGDNYADGIDGPQCLSAHGVLEDIICGGPRYADGSGAILYGSLYNVRESSVKELGRNRRSVLSRDKAYAEDYSNRRHTLYPCPRNEGQWDVVPLEYVCAERLTVGKEVRHES